MKYASILYLYDLMAKAASEHKKDMTEKAGNNASLAESAGTLQSSVGVYVRLTDNQQKDNCKVWINL